MSYASQVIANTILQRAFKEGRQDVSQLKLQKMMFFFHGWMLAVHGRAPTDENFEAWQYGPVLPSVYHAAKRFSAGPISDYLKEHIDGKFVARVAAPSDKPLYEVLDIVWEKYIGIPAGSLSSMTHMPETPWFVTKSAGENVIPNDLIRQYFVGLAKQARKPADRL